MKRAKYSVVLPTLNGAETLAVTLPEMLKLDRDDIEWVISNNCSDDDTEELVRSFSDSRIRLVQTPERLSASKSLEFAYLHAKGEWQGHLGDEDLLFPSRFDVLDEIIAGTDARIVRGESVRYYWSNYPNKDLANTLTGWVYDGVVHEESGIKFAERSLNEVSIHSGGSWAVHCSIIEKVRDRCGYFSPPYDHVEFFAMRAACALSSTIILTGLPFYVHGLHAKSSGSQVFRPKGESTRSDFDPAFEFLDPWIYCPFQHFGYIPISLDAALAVRAMFPEIMGNVKMDWSFWAGAARVELEKLIKLGQLPSDTRKVFNEELKKLPWHVRLRWWLPEHKWIYHIARRVYRLVRLPKEPERIDLLDEYPDRFGWPHALHGERVGIHSIVDVPVWVENTFHGFFPKKRL